MQRANYIASALANNMDKTVFMDVGSRKMHVRWNNFDKQETTNKNSKTIHFVIFIIELVLIFKIANDSYFIKCTRSDSLCVKEKKIENNIILIKLLSL